MHGLFIRRLCNFEISRDFFQIHFSYQLLAQFYYGKHILYDFYFFKFAVVEESRVWCSLLNVHALWEGESSAAVGHTAPEVPRLCPGLPVTRTSAEVCAVL